MTPRSFAAGGALAFLLASVPACAESPTPAAIQDLSKPAFDTTTALYDMAGRAESSAKAVVAEVDGRAITLGDVGDTIRDLPPSMGALTFEQLFPMVLDRLVKREALAVRAHQDGVDQDPEVRRRVRAAADDALANAYLRREVGKGITEKALLDRYAQTVAGKPGPEEVRVRLIMVDTRAEAMALIGELKGGADFAALARRSSKDTTAPAGGDLGFVRRDGLNPEVGAVAFSQAAGQVAPYPVLSNGAWFIVRTEERRQSPPPPFFADRERLRQELLRSGVRTVTDAAVAQAIVREYTISGKDAAGSETGASVPN